LLAKAVAKESEANFIQVKGPSLLSMWVGKSEEGVRKIFERARQVAPCIVFFDEIDAMAGKRGVETGSKVTERVLNQLLAEMDGLEEIKGVTIIAATNRPDMLDPALLRPGRFDRVILVDVPDEASREQILKVHTKNTPLGNDVNFKELVTMTEGFVGADIESLVRESAMNALRVDVNCKVVMKNDFESAFKRIKASVSRDTAKLYKKIEDYYLRSAKAGMEVGPVYTG
jgi:transitional endoplasmic reticulum ATPase